jgi:DNA-binding transcriptional LysR family regulator
MFDRITLDQLRVLIAVAELGSFSAAARGLSRVQSAISQAIQSLETELQLQLFDRSAKRPRLTDAGRAILDEARVLVRGADRLRARAESITADIEPVLTLAVDAMFPDAPLMASLKALSAAFPMLPVTLFTENFGGAEQRLRDGDARLAIYPQHATGAPGLEVEHLTSIPLLPVVAADHPLANQPGPLTRDDLAAHVQLVLADRTPITAGRSMGIVSDRIWRFADLGLRLNYLLAGFGWCRMPLHLVEAHIESGRLKPLELKEHSGLIVRFPIHAIYQPGRGPGRAGRWLLDDLRRRLPAEDSFGIAITGHGIRATAP